MDPGHHGKSERVIPRRWSDYVKTSLHPGNGKDTSRDEEEDRRRILVLRAVVLPDCC